MRKQMEDHARKLGKPIEPATDRRDLSTVIEGFRQIRQNTSLQGTSIREMREEGRRY
ncbi:MAG: hypothetical protein NW220_09030 [Leptolyngbyaceae cyanobacterium bins.349]|nr:hypothetical protein [Leptolyngbyaceae cyanobacterium bins.349]